MILYSLLCSFVIIIETVVFVSESFNHCCCNLAMHRENNGYYIMSVMKDSKQFSSFSSAYAYCICYILMGPFLLHCMLRVHCVGILSVVCIACFNPQ